MNRETLEAYQDLYNQYKQIHSDEYIAKEALQDTMLRLCANGSLRRDIKSPKPFIRAVARTASRSIVRGRREGQWLFYSSETPQSSLSEDDDPLSVYELSLEENDYGQLTSVEDKMVLVEIYKYLGEDLSFFIDHIEFPSRGRLRGVTGVSSRPKLFDSDKERSRHHYLRSKIKKRYE